MYKEFLYFQFISFSLQFHLYGNLDFRKNCELYFVIQLWVCEVKSWISTIQSLGTAMLNLEVIEEMFVIKISELHNPIWWFCTLDIE